MKAPNRSNAVDMDLPSREEIEGALKHLKNNKADGTAVEKRRT
jgi:hypothetical protein